MALYVVLSSGKELQYYIGTALPKLKNEHVMEIQADGHELQAIENQITSIPHCARTVVRWFGDHARFIYYNLKW